MAQTKKSGMFSQLPERDKKDVVLPSGRKITVLETTGHAERLLSSMQKGQDLSVINRFLSLVTENLDGKPGAVAENEFNKMLTGDRSYVLLQVRCISHGSMVDFHLDCPSCGSKSEHELNLHECLDSMVPYPGGDQREFVVNVGPGSIHFELSTGDTEIKIAKIKNPEINTKIRAMKIWEETESGKFPIDLDVLKSKWIADLRKAIKDNECVLDTTAQIQCPSCGLNQRVDIMGNLDFLFPHST